MKKVIIPLLFFALVISGCRFRESTTKTESASRILESMDTIMKLTAYGQNCDAAVGAAENEIKRLNDLLNTEDPESEIALLNRTGFAVLSSDCSDLMSQSIQYYEMTDGFFDITIYPLSKLWGFPSKEYRVPTSDEVSSTLQYIGSDQVLFTPGTSSVSLGVNQAVDFGGIAKGFTSQRIIKLFRDAGISSAIVSLGGNVQCLGSKPDGTPWRIGIQDPQNPGSEILAAIDVIDKAVITSGGYERFFIDSESGTVYKHILNPKTGYPVDNDLASVTIISDDGTLGDALSTALFSMGMTKAVEFWRNHSSEFDAVFVGESNELYITEGLVGSVSSDHPMTVLTYIQ